MRILRYLMIAVLALIGLSGCMQHNGDIGNWFGTWKLASIAIDGAEDPTYDGNIFFQFQSDIVRIVEVDTEISNRYDECFGRWSEEGSTLTLDFSYTADAAGTAFTPPAATLLAKGVNILHIDKSDSKSMTWSYQNPATDQTIEYRLKKQ